MKLKFNHRTGRGFTLFEMVVVMGIVGILAAIAIPSFSYVTTANRIASEGNGLLGDLQFARSEAVKQGQTVTACVSTNGTSCAPNNTNWNLGWIVFSDANSNHVVDANENVLKYQKAFTGNDTFIASNNAAYIIYNREGFSPGLVNGTLITLHASPVSNASTRCLSVTMVGMMQITPYGGPCL